MASVLGKRKQAEMAPVKSTKRARRRRNSAPTFTKELLSWISGSRKTLTEAFIVEAARIQGQRAAPESQVLYRGLCFAATGHALLKHKVGDVIMLHQPKMRPSSWSTQRGLAYTFAGVDMANGSHHPCAVVGCGGIVLRANMARKHIILDMNRLRGDMFDDEAEVIVKPGSFECVVDAVWVR
jgi:hypothetical protein